MIVSYKMSLLETVFVVLNYASPMQIYCLLLFTCVSICVVFKFSYHPLHSKGYSTLYNGTPSMKITVLEIKLSTLLKKCAANLLHALLLVLGWVALYSVVSYIRCACIIEKRGKVHIPKISKFSSLPNSLPNICG